MNSNDSRESGREIRLHSTSATRSTTTRSRGLLAASLLASLAMATSASADLTASCGGDPAENLRNAIRTANGGAGPTTIRLESCAYDYLGTAPDGIDSALPAIRG